MRAHAVGARMGLEGLLGVTVYVKYLILFKGYVILTELVCDMRNQKFVHFLLLLEIIKKTEYVFLFCDDGKAIRLCVYIFNIQ